MPGNAKVNGTWKELTGVSAKVNGSWQEIAEGYTKVNGTWQQWFVLSQPALEQIAIIDLASDSASISFDNIPTGYKDLKIVSHFTIKNTSFTQMEITYNNITSNYDWHVTRPSGDYDSDFGNESSAKTASVQGTSSYVSAASFMEISFPNYRGDTNDADEMSHLISMTGSRNGDMAIAVSGLLNIDNQFPLTSFQIGPQSGTIEAGSKFVLYGFKEVV